VIKPLRVKFTLYPFLFGFFPVLALIAHNAAEMNLTDGIRALSGAILLTLLLYVFLLVVVKDPTKSALLTTFILLLFYSYGQLNILLRSWSIFNLSLGRHRTLIPLYIAIFVVITWLILKTKRDLSSSTRFLNVFGIILLIFPLYQIMAYQIEDYQAQQKQEQALTKSNLVSLTNDQPPPDVYYIVADGYPRSDFIAQYLGVSNTEFLESLEKRGFFVAQCSQANYTDTRFSLASTLNMAYLDGGEDLPEVIYPGSTLDRMIRSGNVQQNFSDLDYTIATFESGYKWLHWEESDLHLAPVQERLSPFFKIGFNDFEQLLLDTTAAKLLIDLPFILNPAEMDRLAEIVNNPRASHRERILYALGKLPVIPEEIPGPKFVYAHIIFPHPPFVMDADGNPLQNSPPNELSAYADQITYLDRRLLEIVDILIENSDPDPVIIIQGDHGATIEYQDLGIDPSKRLGILNAYYLPAHQNELNATAAAPNESLYPTISPVNTFRVIFDRYFNGEYGLLEDRSIVGRQSPYTNLECALPE
jgi:hypothetical protein